jgi:hypothetical protein
VVGPRGRGDREPTAGSAFPAICCGPTLLYRYQYRSFLALRFVSLFDLKRRRKRKSFACNKFCVVNNNKKVRALAAQSHE